MENLILLSILGLINLKYKNDILKGMSLICCRLIGKS